MATGFGSGFGCLGCPTCNAERERAKLIEGLRADSQDLSLSKNSRNACLQRLRELGAL